MDIKIKIETNNKENEDNTSKEKELELGPDGKRYSSKTEPKIEIEITEK